MNSMNNIADTTGRVEYKSSSTKICPDMEQLYFELENKEHVFQIGIPLAWYTEVCSRYDIPLSELFGED